MNGIRSRAADERGFTWSELLLVSVFVVGLVLVAVTSARGIRRDTAVSDCQSERRTLSLALAEYEADTGSFPDDLEVLIDLELVDRDDTSGWSLVPGDGPGIPELEYIDPNRC